MLRGLVHFKDNKEPHIIALLYDLAHHVRQDDGEGFSRLKL